MIWPKLFAHMNGRVRCSHPMGSALASSSYSRNEERNHRYQPSSGPSAAGAYGDRRCRNFWPKAASFTGRGVFESHTAPIAPASDVFPDKFDAARIQRFDDSGEGLDDTPHITFAGLHPLDSWQRDTR